jgi:hypothetical protein
LINFFQGYIGSRDIILFYDGQVTGLNYEDFLLCPGLGLAVPIIATDADGILLRYIHYSSKKYLISLTYMKLQNLQYMFNEETLNMS